MSKITINLVVLNGEKYIRHCLDAVAEQTHPQSEIEFNILDNGSTDRTKEIISYWQSEFKSIHIKVIESGHNFGAWGGWEELLKHTHSEYVVFLSVDVIMDKGFIQNAVAALDADPKIGGLQAKVYQFEVAKLSAGEELPQRVIDTCGFEIHRSRRVSNIGHGQDDRGQFSEPKEIFGIEGAVPIFRKDALESIKVMGEITDHDLFWYAEDLDVAWRLHLAGWKQMYDPGVVAHHDRQTTKSVAHGGWLHYISRVPLRRQIPMRKRRLEWRNLRWTLIKNDYIINVLRDLPYIIVREIEVLGYTLLFEPGVFAEVPQFFKLLPRMFKKRKAVLSKAKVSPSEIHKFFR